jgi:hypothetical protein
VLNVVTFLRSIERARPLQALGARETARAWFWGALLAVAAFGMAQASLGLGNSLSVDEPFTANLVRLPLPQMFAAFQQDNASLPYYMLLKAWAALFGESEIALRSLSVLIFGATILTVGAVAWREAGALAGVVAGLLVATSSNMGLIHAAIARQYALLGFEVALAVAICFALLRREQSPAEVGERVAAVRAPRLWLLLLLLGVVGLLTHATFVFVLGALGTAALFVSRRFFLIMAGVCATALLIYLALWWPMLRATLPLPITSWMRPPQPIDLFYGVRALWGWKRGLLAAGYVGLLLALRFRQARGLLTSAPFRFGLVALVFVLLAPYLVSQVKPVYNPSRTPMLVLPLACALIGVLVGRLGVRLLTLAFVVAIAVGSAQFAVKTGLEPDPIPARQAMQVVAASARCGDTLVVGGLALSEVEYYLRQFGAPDCIARLTFPQDTASHPGWIDSAGLAGRRAELAREAQQLATELAGHPGARVWLFGGTDYGQEQTPLIQRELDRQLSYRVTLDLIGSFFKWVRVYSVPAPP